jgi:hypothetical protein
VGAVLAKEWPKIPKIIAESIDDNPATPVLMPRSVPPPPARNPVDAIPQLRHSVAMGKPTLEKEPSRMHKTTLTLDDQMWRKAKIRAMDEGTSLQKILEAALDAYLKAPKKEPKG